MSDCDFMHLCNSLMQDLINTQKLNLEFVAEILVALH